ncbi:autotransporter outer membrane beta-barrel domain-containing protein [Verrucomicrobium sp. GAS474]|uniref:autotransporter family protein n=1 Tax=Verrucomicrobium sp. GAS474 TaxID=1882831 RepID=UPI000B81EB55|nr:autotransporter outer membrane beta-barrel domain-containing protein [Verrucomicrobium sp. GAS474]
MTISTPGTTANEIHVGGANLLVGAAGSLQAGLIETYNGAAVTIAGSVTASMFYVDATSTTTIATGGTLNVTGFFQLDSGSTLILGDGVIFAPAQFQLNNLTASASLTVNGNDTATISSGISDVSGAVPIFKKGTGTLILSGASTYSGATSVGAGTLQVDGSITSNSIVLSGATLRGAGTVANVTVNSGGTLAAGSASAVGTLTVGDLTLNSGSITALRANGTPSSDQIHATGNITLDGTLKVTPGSGVLNGDTVTLLKADGTLSGTYASVVNSLGNALTFTPNYTAGAGGSVSVTAVQNSFTSFAGNANQSAIARNLDKVVGDSRANALLTALNALPGTSLPAAFTLISPIQQATVSTTSLANSRVAIGTLQSRMDNIRFGSTGLSLSQINLLDDDLPASALLAGTDMSVGQGVKVLAPTPKNRWGFFAATNGNFGDIDGQTVQSSYHGYGGTLGADYRLARSFAVGFAAGYDYSKTEFDNSGSKSTVNTVRFGPYATWQDTLGDWVNGYAGGAHHWYDSDRQGFGGMAQSNTTGLEFNSGLKYGHDFKTGKNKEWTLTPSFALDYTRLNIDDYTESGSLAPLSVQEQTVDSFRSTLGGTAAYGFTWKNIGWTPYVSTGWAHELLDASQTVSARFASGAGDLFSATGDNLGHDSATFGVGLRTALTDTLSATISYNGEANDRYQNHSFNAAVRVTF